MFEPSIIFVILFTFFLVIILWAAWVESCARTLYMEESIRCMKSCASSLEKISNNTNIS